MSDLFNLTTIGGAVIVLFLLYIVYELGPHFVGQFTSPLHRLPGPPSDHWFYGNTQAIVKTESATCQESWMEQYGPTISYQGYFGIYRLFTVDTKALNHVLTHGDDYQKSSQSRYHLARAIGPGVLVAEEQHHRKQRHILNPAFGPAQIRELTDIFIEKSQSLRDLWFAEIAQSEGEKCRLDVLSWLSKVSLDIIGLAGFNYSFDALNPNADQNKLNQAFDVLFNTTNTPRLLTFLQAYFPPARLIKTAPQRKTDEAQQILRRIGMQLIADKKADILVTSENGVKKKDIMGRDLLTLLLKANMAIDIPENQRLSDKEVLEQVPTVTVGGHETTATSTMWALFSLTQHLDVQAQLREELLALNTDTPTMDELSTLPYLDMVVKEVLRFHCPVPTSMRVAMRDDVIPLSTPIIDRNGMRQESVLIQKGDLVIIPIKAVSRYKKLWGEDAHDFKPERWKHLPEAVSSIPGVWGHTLSFLGGSHSCIGYRFAVIEIKSLLFTLVRAFEFELAVEPDKVMKKSAIVERPVILGEDENSNQMPLIIRPYTRVYI